MFLPIYESTGETDSLFTVLSSNLDKKCNILVSPSVTCWFIKNISDMQTEVNESVLFTILPFKMHADWPTAVFCSVSYRYFLTDTKNKFSHVIHIEILGEKLVELS